LKYARIKERKESKRERLVGNEVSRMVKLKSIGRGEESQVVWEEERTVSRLGSRRYI